jgi:hypothetical protein
MIDVPSIAGSRSVAGPPRPLSWERREYRSPDRRWTVIYHTPREWHMGADGWQVQLRHYGLNVGWAHRPVMRLPGSQGFRHPNALQPWSHDSKTLAFLTWNEDPLHLYDLADKSLRQVVQGSEFVYAVQWSPDIDRLLVTSETQAVLIDRRGVVHGIATLSMAPDEVPHSDWMPDGRWFYILARESAGTSLTFYAGNDARFGEAHALDPLQLVPYNAEEFRDLPRQRFCLVHSPSIRAVGQLLDTWHRVEFDQPAATLYLSVYRPTSAVYRDNSERLCHVEERWVAVELDI